MANFNIPAYLNLHSVIDKATQKEAISSFCDSCSPWRKNIGEGEYVKLEYPSNATFTLCCQQPRFIPPWTKRGDCGTGYGNGMDKRSSPWLPWSPGRMFKLSKKLLLQPQLKWPTYWVIVDCGEPYKTWKNVKDRRKTWSMSVAEREARVFPW